MLIYFLIEGDDETIKRYIQSPYGSQCVHGVIPLFYRKLINKATEEKVIKELWRQVMKKLSREIARSWPWEFGIHPAGKVKMLARSIYRYFHANGHVPEGLYVFADLERLSDEALTKAEAARTIIAESGSAVRLLNSPAHTMRRYDVLRTLYEHGINDFNVYRWSDGEWPLKYPVFLRYDNDHAVLSTVLISSREILDYALRHLEESGGLSEHLLITEFCDTADRHGIYRKYSAFVVGNRVFGRNLCFSKRWMVKRASEMKAGELLVHKEMLVEEEDYVKTNPHADILRKIFSLTRVEYGRIDYSMLGDAIRVWEINTNPHITYDGEERAGPRRPIFDLVEQTMLSALTGMTSK
ncbi:MAG: hypothetical protein ABSG91_01770 [Syntrophobacteraceae bacterium]